MAELLRKKKHINVITAEFKPYWEQLFADSEIENLSCHKKDYLLFSGF